MLKIEDNKVMMHQLLQDMGREIVRLESPKEPEKRSRLWHQNDSFHVLREKLGTEKIEGLALDMHMLKEDKSARKIIGMKNTISIRKCSFGFSRLSLDTPYEDSNGVALETNAFTIMRKLKILQLNYVELKGHYKEFPNGLKWLKWHGFPLKHMPNDFPLESLVALDMCYSNLRRVWKGANILGLLKILNLSHSHSLIKTPNFGALPNLERLIMKDCASLIEIHESIGNLEHLVFMNVEDCINLRKLPKGICFLKSLETLIISGCSNLDQLPEDMNNTESLKVFCADRTMLDPMAWALKPRKNLEISWSCLPRSLVTLSLAYCNLSNDSFPRDFSSLPLLLDLNLSGNPICNLPNCVRSLTKLRLLSFRSCKKLQSLFTLPSVVFLDLWNCTSLERVTLAPQASWFICMTGDSDRLVEFDGEFKLEPIGRVDADIVNSLGICNLESMANIEMNFLQFSAPDSKRLMRLPIQGLLEFGMFSTFIPGREVPKGWFSSRNSSSCNSAECSSSSTLSFTVPSCTSIPNHRRRRIHCLNVCSVYALSHREQIWSPPPLFTKISNKTKDLKWIYGPQFFPVPVGDEHVMWLSQWKIGNQFRLEVGDEVNVTVVADVCYEVKECGINIVYEENEEEEKTQQQLDSARPNCQGVSFPERSRIGGAYFRGRRCFNKREGPIPMVNGYDWVSSSDWGKKLFEDFTLTAEEVMEEFKNPSRRYAEAIEEALARMSAPSFSNKSLSLLLFQ